MENLKITTKVLSKISLIINKMGISSLIMKLKVETGNEAADKEELVKELIALLIDNLYKAEEEITSLIADMKQITIEEAAEVDVIDIFKDLFSNEKIRNFLR